LHYLAHYYIDKHIDDPLYVVGLGLPDWVNGFSKLHNQLIKHSKIDQTDPIYAIQQGVLRHYAGDLLFHNHPLFVQLQSELLQSFLTVGLKREEWRLSLLAHVGTELMIDRQIVNAEPHVLDSYYHLLEKADEKLLKKYFDYHGMAVQQQDFLTKFHFFKTRRFLSLFDDVANIAIGLDKMYGRVLKKSFGKQQKEQIELALHNMDSDIRYRWQELLNGIKL